MQKNCKVKVFLGGRDTILQPKFFYMKLLGNIKNQQLLSYHKSQKHGKYELRGKRMQSAAIEILLKKCCSRLRITWVAGLGQQDVRKWNTGQLNLFGYDLSQGIVSEPSWLNPAGWTQEKFNRWYFFEHQWHNRSGILAKARLL